MTKIAFGAANQTASGTFAKLRIEVGDQDTLPTLKEQLENKAEEKGKDKDTVILSEAAKNRAAGDSEAQGEVSKVLDSAQEKGAKYIDDRIKQLQKEIKELEKSDLPEKEKMNQIQDKQTEIMELLKQKGKGGGGGKVIGGTRANSTKPRDGIKGCLLV